jgi:diguanylate cyclase (GGDEF)-like protein
MPPLLELQRDRFFRFRLMVICFGVAFLVSAIYVIVSYRLATDLGIKAEQVSLHRQTMLLHAELVEADNDPQERLTELVELIYLNDHIGVQKLYVEAYGKDFDWSLTHNITPQQTSTLKNRMEAKVTQHHNTPMASGKDTLDGELFLWQVVEGQDYKIITIEVAESLDVALNLVAKRLSITSIIVFWIAAWMAILLSSWMNRRVQSKNNALAKLATYDQLTGLPNRLYLIDMMQKSMPETPKSDQLTFKKSSLKKEVQGCLFVIDLDKFKEVNDAFGHSAGDELLRKVSQRLSVTLGGQYTLARIGGDEFIVWANDIEIKQATSLAKELVAVCNEPVMINQLAVNTGASIGVSHYPTHATDIESLILCADIAMYEAKQARTGWGLFNVRDTETNRQRLRLRADLSEALLEQEIHLYYQPKVELHTGEIVGVEALARWHHPTDGVLYPSSFIDIIEQSGRVQEFGRYVVSTAIMQLAEWQGQGTFTPIAINLSPYNLLDLGLLNFTLQLLDDFNVSPDMLEIELVESSTSINIEQISYRINKFKEAGIKLAIDDFGTGMSSLSYISNLNVDLIKIDRSFIDGVDKDPKKQAIIFTAVTLAQSFDTKLLAEGIETKAQADLLMQMGCRYGQGYYYAKPMKAKQMKNILLTKAVLPIK